MESRYDRYGADEAMMNDAIAEYRLAFGADPVGATLSDQYRIALNMFERAGLAGIMDKPKADRIAWLAKQQRLPTDH
jgi:hypothetical protein